MAFFLIHTTLFHFLLQIKNFSALPHLFNFLLNYTKWTIQNQCTKTQNSTNQAISKLMVIFHGQHFITNQNENKSSKNITIR